MFIPRIARRSPRAAGSYFSKRALLSLRGAVLLTAGFSLQVITVPLRAAYGEGSCTVLPSGAVVCNTGGGHLQHISLRTTLCSCPVTSVSAGALTRYALRTRPSVSTLVSQPVGYLGIRCLTAILCFNWKRKLVRQRAGCSVSFLTALQMLANPAMGTHRCHRRHRCHRAPPKHGRRRSKISQSRRSTPIPALQAWCNWGPGSG